MSPRFIRMALLVVLELCGAALAAGQSADVERPTPVTSNEIRGTFTKVGFHYYGFAVGKGDASIVVSGDGPVAQSQMAHIFWQLLNEDLTEAPVGGGTVLGFGYEEAPDQALRAGRFTSNADAKVILRIKVEFTMMPPDGVPVQYRVKLGGTASARGAAAPASSVSKSATSDGRDAAPSTAPRGSDPGKSSAGEAGPTSPMSGTRFVVEHRTGHAGLVLGRLAISAYGVTYRESGARHDFTASCNEVVEANRSGDSIELVIGVRRLPDSKSTAGPPTRQTFAFEEPAQLESAVAAVRDSCGK